MTLRCRSCHAPIVWAETEAGKRIPLDEKPATVFQLQAVALGPPKAVPVRAHVSHFATCPHADEWRKTHGKED